MTDGPNIGARSPSINGTPPPPKLARLVSPAEGAWPIPGASAPGLEAPVNPGIARGGRAVPTVGAVRGLEDRGGPGVVVFGRAAGIGGRGGNAGVSPVA